MQRYHLNITIHGVHFSGKPFFLIQCAKLKQTHSLEFSVGPSKHALYVLVICLSCKYRSEANTLFFEQNSCRALFFVSVVWVSLPLPWPHLQAPAL